MVGRMSRILVSREGQYERLKAELGGVSGEIPKARSTQMAIQEQGRRIETGLMIMILNFISVQPGVIGLQLIHHYTHADGLTFVDR